MADELVLTEVAQRVAVVTLNRPTQRNAIDQAMVDAVRAALDGLEREPELRAVVLTGAGGKAFAGGADIGQLRERGAIDALRRINQGLCNRVEAVTVPTIAAIEGWCLGGGCELAMACDLRVAGAGARFGQPEVGLGLIPGAGGPQRLTALVGLGKARELIFTGATIDAAEAARIGLVNRVVPDGAALGAARELAETIAAQGALAVRLAKVVVNSGVRGGADSRDALEYLAQAVLFESEDKRVRMDRFLAERMARRDEAERAARQQAEQQQQQRANKES